MNRDEQYIVLKQQFLLYQLGKLGEVEELTFRTRAQAYPELLEALSIFDEEEAAELMVEVDLPPKKMDARPFTSVLPSIAQENEFPIIRPNTTVEDLDRWLKGKVEIEGDFAEPHSQLLEKNAAAKTLLVHAKGGFPEEVHHHYIEQFLILDGTCNIYLEGEPTVQLGPGAFFRIPMFRKHSVEITSECPCVFICQRVYLT